jgi:hypothetical protein
MLSQPWIEEDPKRSFALWGTWILGWLWSLAGLVVGASFAPALVQAVSLRDSPYENAFVIGVAVAAGFLGQFVGWLLWFLLAVAPLMRLDRFDDWLDSRAWPPLLKVSVAALLTALFELPLLILIYFLAALSVALPFAAISYGLYRYLTAVGLDQELVAVAAAGGLLVKALLIPLMTSAIMLVLRSWRARATGIRALATPSEA